MFLKKGKVKTEDNTQVINSSNSQEIDELKEKNKKNEDTIKTLVLIISSLNKKNKNILKYDAKTSLLLENVYNFLSEEKETLSSLDESITSNVTVFEQTSSNLLAIDKETKKTLEEIELATPSMQKIENIVNILSKDFEVNLNDVEKLVTLFKNIEDIAKTITAISKKTNLLALNASIEAARAGQEGKGFSVVAQEIKKLADSTETEASKISNIVNNNIKNVDNLEKSTIKNKNNIKKYTYNS